MINICDCRNKAQDELHGKNMRVMNPMGINQTKVRCTICRKEYSVSKANIVDKLLAKE